MLKYSAANAYNMLYDGSMSSYRSSIDSSNLENNHYMNYDTTKLKYDQNTNITNIFRNTKNFNLAHLSSLTLI